MNSKTQLHLLIAFFIVTISLKTAAQNETKTEYIPPLKKEITIETTTVFKNMRYASIPKIANDSISDRILDLYLPKKSSETQVLPVLLFIHGGGFTGGDKGMMDLCSKMASYGFAVVSINYRLTLKYKKVNGASCSGNMSKGLPKNGYFHPVLNEAIANASEDAILALKWIKNNADKYKLDINKVAISGGSAGAMTALYVAYVSNQKELPIKAVVNLWGGLENAELIGVNPPSLLTYHGDLDKTISIDYAYALDKRMKALGSEKSVIQILEGKGHAQYKYIAENKVPEIAQFLKANF